MTRRGEGQRGFGQVVVFGLLGPPETLRDPALRRIDGLLDDEALVDAVWRALRSRYPQSARRGRRATPAEVVLRLLVLKHLKTWSYEQLEWEVRGSVAYRHFCRLGSGTVPDGKTLVRLGQLLEGDLLRAVLERVVGVAVERQVTRGRAPAAAAVTGRGAGASAPRPDPTRDDAPAGATGRAPDPRPHRARGDDRRRQAGEPL